MTHVYSTHASIDFSELATHIKQWGVECGFQQIGITDTDLSHYEPRFQEWLAKHYHGEMDYMSKHGTKRSRPAELVPGTERIIVARMDYLTPTMQRLDVLKDPSLGAISYYALGKDYHRLIRKRLKDLAKRIQTHMKAFHYHAFVDSGPVLEKPLAEKAGLGWIGKNTLLLNRHAGSWFFLGTLFTDLPLPVDHAVSAHCGSCTACIDICPTKAIVAPYQLDARKCISYLTIELKGSIPVELRRHIGNRIFGCDDCQLVCPWNRYAKYTQEMAFLPKQELVAPNLIQLFQWTEETFLQKTEGSAIKRTGYIGWLRNIAIALGNAPFDPLIVQTLEARLSHPSELLREHIQWALDQHSSKRKKCVR